MIPESVARRHLVRPGDTPYPKIAQAAGVVGVIEFDLLISEDGRVIDADFLSPPPAMLGQAALDGVMGWRFEPFGPIGRPVAVRTFMAVTFERGAFAGAARSLSGPDVLEACQSGLASRNVAACLDALRAPRRIENAGTRLVAAELLTDALVQAGQVRDAAFTLETVVKGWEAKTYPEAGLDLKRVARSAGVVQRALGDLQAASQFFDRADNGLRRACATKSPRVAREACTGGQRAFLVEYEQLLREAGRVKDADEVQRRRDLLPTT